MIVALRAQEPPPAQPFVPPPPPAQPIPYSHKQHLALGLECRQCHVNPDAGTLMTYPATAICMSCHQAIAADRPSIQKLARFAASGTPVPWVRVYQLPDYVFWSHGAHLKAGIQCAECHGDVPSLDVMSQQTDIVTMLGCQRCHDRRQAFTDCGDCHEPRR
jgi:c(7)-type cytochrome triheme protein